MFDAPANEENIYSQHMIGVISDIHYNDITNAKYWYEKARSKGCIESIYNLGQISLKLNDDLEAEKYYKEGLKMGSKKCEYMLAGLYYKKSLDMYSILSIEGYGNCKDIVDAMPNIDIDVNDMLIAPFEIQNNIEDDEEYVPKYILDKKENLEDMLRDVNLEMIIDDEKES